MAKAKDVANYLLSLSTPNTPRAITPLKLQKLVYYSQGWHMALNNGEPLFDDDILAWEHGPVVSELYFDYKHYGYLTINPQPFSNITTKNKKIFSNKQLEILKAVWDSYGEYDGKYLEELTHQEEPWLTTNRNEIIKKQKIKSYFNRLTTKKL
ncbi:Panacea domain-containing protein [Priestia sp. YIM B13448]|uniref:Panacea domain-containing protein n=1 Tax=Priestia sp. YIM B13448 TaxID=3366308 RepID=UPI003672C6AB